MGRLWSYALCHRDLHPPTPWGGLFRRPRPWVQLRRLQPSRGSRGRTPPGQTLRQPPTTCARAPLPARNSAALRALSVLGGQFIGLIVKARIWAVSARCGASNQRLLLCQNEPGLAHAVTAGTLSPPMYALMLWPPGSGRGRGILRRSRY